MYLPSTSERERDREREYVIIQHAKQTFAHIYYIFFVYLYTIYYSKSIEYYTAECMTTHAHTHSNSHFDLQWNRQLIHAKKRETNNKETKMGTLKHTEWMLFWTLWEFSWWAVDSVFSLSNSLSLALSYLAWLGMAHRSMRSLFVFFFSFIFNNPYFLSDRFHLEHTTM